MAERVDSRPRVAVVNDYEIVVAGLSTMLAPYLDRIILADAVTIDEPVQGPAVDVALYDTYGREGLELAAIRRLLAEEKVHTVAIYSAHVPDTAVNQALRAGVRGYLSKATPAEELVEQIERIANGELVVDREATNVGAERQARLWPGKGAGLSERESEIVALVALGKRNAEVADAVFISVETVKTHLARASRKLGLSNRTQVAAYVLQDPTFRRSGNG